MKILIISQYFWPEAFRVNDLVRDLVARGHDVTVLTGIPNYPEGNVFPEFAADRSKYRNYYGAKIVRVPMLARGRGALRLILNYLSFAFSASFVGAFLLRGKSFDAIFVYEPSPITVGLPAVILRFLKKAPVLFWVLDLWPETLEAVGVVKSRRALALVGKLVGFIYNRCDLILAQSKAFFPSIARYLDDQRKIRYFPSWAEDEFSNHSVEPAREIQCSNSQLTVMFAGNIGEAQDFPAIVVAARILRDRKDIRWVIVGDGRMADWVRGETKALDNFHMVGRFEQERMPSFYKCADVMLVALKRSDAFSRTIPAKVQGYLAAGVPIIGMLDGEGARVINDAGAGLTCDAGDSFGLAELVAKMANMSNSERIEMGIAGAEYSRANFNKATLMAQLEQMFLEASTSFRSGDQR